MGFLTDRAWITGITKTNLFHIVDVNDTSQGNPDGSSYKGSVDQFIELINSEYVKLTGDTMTGPLTVPSLTSTTAQTDILIISTDPTEVYTNEVLVRNSSTGEVEKKDLSHYNFGFHVQTGDSASVTDTIVETTILDGSIGTLSVPANGFKVGDSFHVKIGGVVSALNGATLTFRVKTGSVVLGSDSITFTNGVTSRAWEFKCDFTIRSIGAATIASILSNGTFSYNVNSDIYGAGFNNLENTNFNTTVLNTLDFTVQWGASSASNSIYSTMCILNKLY